MFGSKGAGASAQAGPHVSIAANPAILQFVARVFRSFAFRAGILVVGRFSALMFPVRIRRRLSRPLR